MSPFPLVLPRRLLAISLWLALFITLAIIWWITGAQPQPEVASAASAVDLQQVDAFEVRIISDSPPNPQDKRKRVGETVTFTATVPIDPQHNFTYTWSFGEKGHVAKNIYDSDGIFQAHVIVSNGSQSVQKMTTVGINPPLPPPITPVPPSPSDLAINCNDPVFANTTVNCFATWQGNQDVAVTWNFGDETSLVYGQTVSHIYAEPRDYTVTATIALAKLSVQRTVRILEEPPTGLDFSMIEPARSGQPITFIATTQTGSRLTFEWTWGDGEISQGREVQHAYQKSDSYPVTLRAYNTSGELSIEKTVLIPPQPPELIELFNNSPKLKGQPIDFFVSTRSEEAVTYLWEWGDQTTAQTDGVLTTRENGETVSDTRASHAYQKDGKYPVRITARNSGGERNFFDIAYVNVDLPTQAIVITVFPPIIGVNMPTKFTAKLAEGNPANFTFEWSFCESSPVRVVGNPEIFYAFPESKLCIVSVTATPAAIDFGSVQKADLPVLAGYGLFYPLIANNGIFETVFSLPLPTPTSTITATATPTATVTVTATRETTSPSDFSATKTPTTTTTITPNLTLTPVGTPTPVTAFTPNPILATESPVPTPETPQPTIAPTVAAPTATPTPMPTNTPRDNGTIPPAPG